MTKKNISKYSVLHPLITPEFFVSHLDETKVKSLAVYIDPTKSPELLYDTPKAALSYVFESDSMIEVVRLHPNYHMYIDVGYIMNDDYVNIIATNLYRLSACSMFGKLSHNSIRGPVLLFSSVSAMTKQYDGNDYSIPYELLEQTLRLYSQHVELE